MLRDPSAASARQLRSTECQRGAFIVYLMFDVIKGQFGTMFGRTVGAFIDSLSHIHLKYFTLQ